MFRIIILICFGFLLYYHFKPDISDIFNVSLLNPSVASDESEKLSKKSSDELVQDQIKKNFFYDQMRAVENEVQTPNMDQLASDFASTVMAKTINSMLKTERGKVFLYNLVGAEQIPQSYSVRASEFSNDLFNILVLKDSNKPKACCGKLAHIEYKIYDEYEEPIVSDAKQFFIGNSIAKPVFDSVLAMMHEGQVIQSYLKTDYIQSLLPIDVQSKRCRVVIEMTNLLPRYIFKTDEIKIFNENPSSKLYVFCSDKLSCDISCKILQNDQLLFEKKDMIIHLGDANLPGILNYALPNEFVPEKRTIICPAKYLKSFSGKDSYAMCPNIAENEYVILEITKIKRRND
ncbi:putative peptidyl-prolyl cis-trans isomerase [Rickettsiales endosymbiont of Paramecium tredecaurelia]|uniref:hypothetical protein n=1 Tax=Candidatus Sarmatiella mevalonica TaxID=2770581 RepID=UPI0019244D9D|nr:hypothetical protein [Candidatus Sarmatiella mevalonica]MBL3284735.1 putative peptidyl-prolyl cis-trans isomerase [Candidatus Sarmatiella mevalonica]